MVQNSSNNKLFDKTFIKYIIGSSNIKITISVLILFIIGIVIRTFSYYPLFLYHQVSLLAVIVITIFTLKSFIIFWSEFKREINLDTDQKTIYLKIIKYTESNVCTIIPIIGVIFYFTNIYLLKYFKIDLVGIYALVLGGTALYLSLFCYIQFVIVILYIYKMKKITITKDTKFNRYIPAHTNWLIYASEKINTYKVIFFVVGLLFTLQYAVLSPSTAITISANKINFNVSNEYSYILTWGGIFLFIIIGFPIIAYISESLIKDIIRKFKTHTTTDLQITLETIIKSKEIDENKKVEAIKAYSALIKDVENSSDYPIKKNKNAISIVLSLLTISIHLSNLVLNVSKIVLQKF